jgi:hypothetical protein
MIHANAKSLENLLSQAFDPALQAAAKDGIERDVLVAGMHGAISGVAHRIDALVKERVQEVLAQS